MIARAVLWAALLLAAPTLQECETSPSGGGGNWWDEPQQVQQQKDDGCPPKTSFSTPGSGTVVDVMDCPALFNTGTIRYVQVEGTDSGMGSRTVWSSNGMNCEVGSSWSEISGC